jgi:hypothetical protein
MKIINKEIISEIVEIRRMMGLKTNNNLLTEAVVGGGILDDLIELLAKKTPDEILELGFKNADEIITFVKEFPTAPITRQTEIIGTIFSKIGADGISTLSKELLDDASSYIGKTIDDRISFYDDMAKKYPNISPEEFASKIKEDIQKSFKSSNPNVQSIVKKIEDEAGERLKTKLGKDVKNVVTDNSDEILKIQNEIAQANSIDQMLLIYKKKADWDKLYTKDKNGFESFVRANKGKSPAQMAADAELEFVNRLKNSTLKKERRAELFGIFKNMHWSIKVGTVLALSGAFGIPFLRYVGWIGGNAYSALDLEDLQEGFKKGSENSEEPESSKSTENCGGNMENFVAHLKSIGISDTTNATVTSNGCEGTLDGVGFKYEDGKWG